MPPQTVLPILLFLACVLGLATILLVMGRITNPRRPSPVKRMPYESGMNPVHDTRRRFDVRFHLLAIAFLVFDVELLFLYPWAVVLPQDACQVMHGALVAGATVPEVAGSGPETPLVRPIFVGGMIFMAILVLGFVYDWRKGVFRWR